MSGDTTFERRRFNKMVGGAVATAGLMSGISGVKGQEDEEEERSIETVWETQDGGATQGVTIVDGTAYLGGQTNLYAVNIEDGSEEWRFDDIYKDNFGSITTPTVVDGSVYLVSGEGELYSISSDSGDEEWVSNEFIMGPYTPTVADGTIYAMGGIGFDSNNLIHAMNPETGEVEWQYPRPESLTNPSSSPVVVGNTVFFGVAGSGDTSGVYAVDAESGEERWRFTEIDDHISLTVSDGKVYAEGIKDRGGRSPIEAQKGGVYAIDAESGEEVWRQVSGIRISRNTKPPTVLDGTVYIIGAELKALDGQSGEVMWGYSGDITWNTSAASPTVVGDRVYPLAGRLYSVDTETGEAEWSSEVSSSGHPLVVDGTIYFPGGDGSTTYLYAVDADVSGSSSGSRVNLGTVNHHGEWDGTAPSLDVSFTSDSSSAESTSTGPNEGGDSSPTEGEGQGLPGFTAVSGLFALTAGWILNNRKKED